MSPKLEGKALAREREILLRAIGKIVVPQAALQLLRDGQISIEGKTEDQVFAEVAAHLRSQLESKTPFGLVTDHATDILPEARRFLRQQQYELSALYFATYFEHRLNWIVVQICQKKRIDAPMVKQLLRDASMRAKCTWVMAVLGQTPFPKEKLAAILEISELRNAFIHYKWPVELSNAKESSREQTLMKLKKAEAIVRYLRKFEEDHLYDGRGRRLLRALRNGPKRRTRVAGV